MGPYIVSSIRNGRNVTAYNFHDHDDVKSVHISMVCHYRINLNNSKNKNWLVEQIIAKRKVHRKNQYLVKWKYWDESFNEWVPTENIDISLIKEWKARQELSNTN
jgi:hypothetical protein